MIKKIFSFFKRFFKKEKVSGDIIIDNRKAPIVNDLLDKSMSNKDKVEIRTYTKKWVDIILATSVIDIQLVFVLAFLGKENIAESLGIAIVTEIIGTISGYFVKSLLETYFEKKNELTEKLNLNKEEEEKTDEEVFG